MSIKHITKYVVIVYSNKIISSLQFLTDGKRTEKTTEKTMLLRRNIRRGVI